MRSAGRPCCRVAGTWHPPGNTCIPSAAAESTPGSAAVGLALHRAQTQCGGLGRGTVPGRNQHPQNTSQRMLVPVGGFVTCQNHRGRCRWLPAKPLSRALQCRAGEKSSRHKGTAALPRLLPPRDAKRKLCLFDRMFVNRAISSLRPCHLSLLLPNTGVSTDHPFCSAGDGMHPCHWLPRQFKKPREFWPSQVPADS